MSKAEMRAALDRHWAAPDPKDLEVEHAIDREDGVLNYPQSGERMRGCHTIQVSRVAQPNQERSRSAGSWARRISG